MADTPATTPPAATPPSAKGSSLSKLASTFDARVALARQGLAKSADAPEPAPKAKPAPVVVDNIDEPPPAEGAEPEEAAEPEAATEEGGEPEEQEETETESEPGTPEERIAAAEAAWDKNDFDGICKALGKDPAKVNLPTRKRFRALAREVNKVTKMTRTFESDRQKAQSELAAESNRLSQLGRALANKYGPAEQAQKAMGEQDAMALGKALERQLGTDLVTITQLLASGKSGLSPEEKKLAEKAAELARKEAELEAKAKKGDDDKTVAQKRQAAIERTGAQLKGHPYLVTADGKEDAEALTEVFEAYEKTWDGKRFTKSPKQVADELQKKLEERARAKGLVKTTPAAPGKKPAAKPGVKKPPAPRLAEPPRTTPRKDLGTKEHMEETRDMRIAQAKRALEMQQRGLRG